MRRSSYPCYAIAFLRFAVPPPCSAKHRPCVARPGFALAFRRISVLCCAIAYPSFAIPSHSSHSFAVAGHRQTMPPHRPAFLCLRTAPLFLASAPLLFALPLPFNAMPSHAFAYHIQTVPYFALATPHFAIPLRSILRFAIAFRLFTSPSLCSQISAIQCLCQTEHYNATAVFRHALPLPFAARLCTAPALQFIAFPLLCHASPRSAFATPRHSPQYLRTSSLRAASHCYAFAWKGSSVPCRCGTLLGLAAAILYID